MLHVNQISQRHKFKSQFVGNFCCEVSVLCKGKSCAPPAMLDTLINCEHGGQIQLRTQKLMTALHCDLFQKKFLPNISTKMIFFPFLFLCIYLYRSIFSILSSWILYLYLFLRFSVSNFLPLFFSLSLPVSAFLYLIPFFLFPSLVLSFSLRVLFTFLSYF